MKKNTRGFTLIELLVVIAIIGLLSTLAVVALNNARQKARDAKRVSDVKQIQTALELYFNDESGYPNAVTTGGTITGATSGTTYMGAVPSNPDPRADGGNCASGADYVYSSVGPTTYALTYCLAAKTGDIPPGVHTATPAGIK